MITVKDATTQLESANRLLLNARTNLDKAYQDYLLDPTDEGQTEVEMYLTLYKSANIMRESAFKTFTELLADKPF